MAAVVGNESNCFLDTKAAAESSGIPASMLRVWRSRGGGSKFYKARGRGLHDADLDDFIRSGIRFSSVQASQEERNLTQ